MTTGRISAFSLDAHSREALIPPERSLMFGAGSPTTGTMTSRFCQVLSYCHFCP
jgi:hypothetical protein